MKEPIEVRIVKQIIRDIDGRMGLSEYFRSIDPEVRVKMFENWMTLTAQELRKDGLIQHDHQPIMDVNTTSYVDIFNNIFEYYRLEDDKE